jgi:predicted amidophosphoribosyltransferase
MVPPNVENPLPPTSGPIRISGGSFTGWALEPHLTRVRTPSGSVSTVRTELAEMMYRFRYQGERSLLETIAGRYAGAINELVPVGKKVFDSLIMVPPQVSRPDYPAVIAFVSELSRITGIVSTQFAVKCDSVGRDQTAKAYDFSSRQALNAFTGKSVLAIDDIYRSGRSLHAFCRLLKEEGKAASVSVLVGTVLH